MLLTTLAVALPVLPACGGEDGAEDLLVGNTATGTFRPPPLPATVDPGVQAACDASSPTLDRIRDEGILFWAIGVSPPFGFELRSGIWAGVEAQNAAELAAVLGVDLDVSEYSYDVLPEALVSGQADIAGAELFVTDERRELIDYSRPYYRSGQLFYVLEDSPYRTIGDLDHPDVRFVYGTGTAQLELAQRYVPRAQVSDQPLGTRLLLHDALAAGEADATMSQAAAVKVVRERFRSPPLAAIGRRGRVSTDRPAQADVLDPFDVAFGLPRGDAAWRGCIDAWVGDLLDSGRMQRRIDYWLGQPVS